MSDRRFSNPETLFFGIGAQKAGTTWLHAYLAGHPQVHVPVIAKELHYWNTIRAPHHPWLKRQGRRSALARYLGPVSPIAPLRHAALWQRALHSSGEGGHRDYARLLTAGARNARAVGEITPAYALVEAGTFTEMASLAPKVRFIYLLRDPVERALSALRMEVVRATGTVTHDRLEKAVRETLDDDRHGALARSRYDLTLTRLGEAGVLDKTWIAAFETLFQQGEVDRLTRALGLDPHPADVHRKVFEGAGSDIQPSQAQCDALRAELAPAYDAAHEHLGQLPTGWN